MLPTIRVLIADDHPVIRQGLRALLSTEADFGIVGESDDGRKAVELATRTKPDIVLMDVAMPVLNGVAAARQILKRNPKCRVLALSTYTDDEAVSRMLEAGVVGYVTKQSAADELVNAIRQAMAGGTYFSRNVAATVQRVRNGGDSNKSPPKKDLNDREKDVVKLIAEGLTNKEIALRLEFDLSQMRYCRERIMNKLNVRSVAELTRFAVAQGWVPLKSETPEPSPDALSAPDSRARVAA